MGLRTKRRAMVLLKDIVQRKRHIGSGRYRPQKARYRRALGYTGTKLPGGTRRAWGFPPPGCWVFSGRPRPIPPSTPTPCWCCATGRWRRSAPSPPTGGTCGT